MVDERYGSIVGRVAIARTAQLWRSGRRLRRRRAGRSCWRGSFCRDGLPTRRESGWRWFAWGSTHIARNTRCSRRRAHAAADGVADVATSVPSRRGLARAHGSWSVLPSRRPGRANPRHIDTLAADMGWEAAATLHGPRRGSFRRFPGAAHRWWRLSPWVDHRRVHHERLRPGQWSSLHPRARQLPAVLASFLLRVPQVAVATGLALAAAARPALAGGWMGGGAAGRSAVFPRRVCPERAVTRTIARWRC